MSTARKKKPLRASGKAPASPPPAKPTRRAKNLSLSPEAIARGEAYSRRHGTRLSKLVGDFLRALPLDHTPGRPLSPAVRRLYGVAAGAPDDAGASIADDYREHLHRKYTGR